MCGFCGLANFSKNMSGGEYSSLIKKMNDLISYRGPDDDGVWIDEKKGIALGHRRLSIIDLSSSGHQPMVSRSRRFVIVYNGEVYNFERLRNELLGEGIYFEGHSDTEVILEYIEKYGIHPAVQKFTGMFSFALLDKYRNKLFLVRDRLGIKPLFYSLDSSNLVFASELKPLMESGKIRKKINTDSLTQYFKYNYIPAPQTIFENVYKLIPGSILEYDLDNESHTVKKYWDLKKIFSDSSAKEYSGTERQALQHLKDKVDDAVECRMVSDVPLGAFLSGGIDSSLIVATMQNFSGKSVNTFSIGYENKEYNEAVHAKEVAEYLGTKHTELYVSEKEAREIIPEIPKIWDEPFADSSQIPTYFVSKLAKTDVTVSLSGDGGDELFGGYGRYFNANAVWNKIKRLPHPVRKGMSSVLDLIPKTAINRGVNSVSLLNNEAKLYDLGIKVEKLSQAIGARSKSEIYERWRTRWKDTGFLFNFDANGHTESSFENIPGRNFIEQMMVLDIVTYMPDDILTKVDRASMAHSLEVRVPLLDHRIVEFSAKLPIKYKLSKHGKKPLLRQLLYQYVPSEIVERPKMGFRVPFGHWIRGPLKNWAKDLLSEKELAKHNLLNSNAIQYALKSHLKKEGNYKHILWDALMFQSWYNNWLNH